ncbi:PREDICTED: UPF0739 protein C1orf74 homolog, partial [Acanthisitta chloris]|uniref:UPF0739 protein C1orf74 homolog n=1 Tax=Acanthisitta chloris TaxID=57068 RepID=UPI0004F0D3EA
TRRRFSASQALHLAGEVLAVGIGLKPALLYDCGAEGTKEMLRYLRGLRDAGLSSRRLHVLGIEGSVLLLNPELARKRLEDVICADSVLPFVDVSARKRCPTLCGRAQGEVSKSHLTSLLAHLEAAETTSADPVSSSEVVLTGWNLCTIFGVLLGYPVVYTFCTEESAENCLALTPLRVFTVQASCPRIKDGLRIQIYSFSIPESLCAQLAEVLAAWQEELKEAFSAQSDFVDLCVSSEVVSLPAVAL